MLRAMASLERFALAPDLTICRILNGMWQVSGGHGRIEREKALRSMAAYVDAGFTTWDLADHYGPAEDFVGEFRGRYADEHGERALLDLQFCTKKYKRMVDDWGGWRLFQELLAVLNEVATRHAVGITTVAVRWVLDRPAVAGAILGRRLGLSDHRGDDTRIFAFGLDARITPASGRCLRNRGISSA